MQRLSGILVFGKFTETTEKLDHVGLHLAIVGPLPYSEGFKYLLTWVDRLTRWPEAIPLVGIKSKTFAMLSSAGG